MRCPEEITWNNVIVYDTMWSLLVGLEHWSKKVDNEEKKVLMTGCGSGIDKIRSPQQLAYGRWLDYQALSVRGEGGRRAWATVGDHLSWDKVLYLAEEARKVRVST